MAEWARYGSETAAVTDKLPILEVQDLWIRAGRSQGVWVLKGVSFRLQARERLAVLGPSGAGKSSLLLALQGLLPAGLVQERGSVRFSGQLAGGGELPWRSIRKRVTRFVPQEPALALHPLRKLRTQLVETALVQLGRDQAKLLLDFPDRLPIRIPTNHLDRYPHELSGGERRRFLVALGLLGRPQLVLADEPTVSLDAVSAAEFLEDLLWQLDAIGAALVWVGHDLAHARTLASRWAVLEDGELKVEGTPEDVLSSGATPWLQRVARTVERRRWS